MSGDRPRVLLVDPCIAREDPMERKFVELYPSLGLLTRRAYLRQAGVEVAMADLTFDRDARAVGRTGRRFRPHLLGVHTKTLTFDRATDIGRQAKELGAAAVAGGPDSATRSEVCPARGFDAVVPGEVEPALEASRSLRRLRPAPRARGRGTVV